MAIMNSPKTRQNTNSKSEEDVGGKRLLLASESENEELNENKAKISALERGVKRVYKKRQAKGL